jgi:cysteine desulfurase
VTVYLDYAATTPCDERVVAAMLPVFAEAFGNPSSVHGVGRRARALLEEARRRVAQAVGAQPAEVIFTSGATEADNLAVLGILRASRRRHLIVGAAEHHAVLHAAEVWQKAGGEVSLLPVDACGRPRLESLGELVRPDTGLCSVMLGNNEVGALADLPRIAEVVHGVGAYLHTDAVQALRRLPVRMADLGVDALSLSAHKIYGPKGVGALVLRSGVPIDPLVVGGSQERGRRAGTENLPAIVGFGVAALLAVEEGPAEAERLRRLSAAFEEALLAIPGSHRNGPPVEERLPHIVNVRFDGVDGESLLLALDLEGVAASSGSACTSGSLSPSHVLLAMGLTPEEARGAVRFSLGRESDETTLLEVARTVGRLVERIRAVASPA